MSYLIHTCQGLCFRLEIGLLKLLYRYIKNKINIFADTICLLSKTMLEQIVNST